MWLSEVSFADGESAPLSTKEALCCPFRNRTSWQGPDGVSLPRCTSLL